MIDEEGNKLGEFLTQDALQLAQSKGLDLIEVAPGARPPVCKLGDWGQMKYEKKKRDNEAKKRQHKVQLKELKVRPKTDDHDMAVKTKRIRGFLEDGNKVKIVVFFRGREHAHHDIGAQQCLRLAKGVEDVGKIESAPRMDGRRMFMILAPLNPGGKV